MLRYETVTPGLIETLRTLTAVPRLLPFRLVGGTAIALQMGHRRSIDIDLFSNEKMNKQIVAHELTHSFPGIECFLTEDCINTRIHQVKVDIYDDWIIPFREPPVVDEGVRMASLKDLAAFKLTAITERREKKDYVDLFFLFKKLGGLPLLIEYRNYNPQLSPKSLLFALEEAGVAETNHSPMPDMLLEVNWNDIKDCMHKAAKEYLQHVRNN